MARRGRADLQDESVAAEQDSEQLRQRRRRLVDVCFEWMSRGDSVSILSGGQRFEGQLIAAVSDLLVLRTKTLTIAFNLASVAMVKSNRRSTHRGTTGDRSVASFRAQLGTYEIDEIAVRIIGLRGEHEVEGTIVASTEDHILLNDAGGAEVALPWSGIAYVLEPISE